MEEFESKFEKQLAIHYETSEEFKRIYFSGTIDQIAEIYAKLSVYPGIDPERIKALKEREKKIIKDFIDKNKKENKEATSQITPPPFRLYLNLLKRNSYKYEKIRDVLQKLDIAEDDNPVFSSMMYNGYSDDPKKQEEQWNEIKSAFESVINKYEYY